MVVLLNALCNIDIILHIIYRSYRIRRYFRVLMIIAEAEISQIFSFFEKFNTNDSTYCEQDQK